MSARRKPVVRRCRVCGCTERDCLRCVRREGEPCHWIGEQDLCSACGGADNPLKVSIEKGELVIRLGIERLDGHERHPTFPALTFLDRHAWARDVVYEIGREEEDGTTPFCALLETVIAAAIDNGSTGIDYNRPVRHPDE